MLHFLDVAASFLPSCDLTRLDQALIIASFSGTSRLLGFLIGFVNMLGLGSPIFVELPHICLISAVATFNSVVLAKLSDILSTVGLAVNNFLKRKSWDRLWLVLEFHDREGSF